jgi:hypothetical protein
MHKKFNIYFNDNVVELCINFIKALEVKYVRTCGKTKNFTFLKLNTCLNFKFYKTFFT